MTRAYSTAAIVCATLSAVAVVCSHNHANAPFVALALAALSAGAFLRWRKITVR